VHAAAPRGPGGSSRPNGGACRRPERRPPWRQPKPPSRWTTRSFATGLLPHPLSEPRTTEGSVIRPALRRFCTADGEAQPGNYIRIYVMLTLYPDPTTALQGFATGNRTPRSRSSRPRAIARPALNMRTRPGRQRGPRQRIAGASAMSRRAVCATTSPANGLHRCFRASSSAAPPPGEYSPAARDGGACARACRRAACAAIAIG
jgi:hypothetical protein